MTKARKWVLLGFVSAVAALALIPSSAGAATLADVRFPLSCHQEAGPYDNGGCSRPTPWGSALYSINVYGAGTVQISSFWGFGNNCLRGEAFYPIPPAGGVSRKQTGLEMHSCPQPFGIAHVEVAIETYVNGRRNTITYVSAWMAANGTGVGRIRITN